MAISDNWSIDYTNKEIRHVDGVLSYNGNLGTAPSAGDVIRGTTSGVTARIIDGSDLGGTNPTGTLTLTDTTGLFESTESLEVLSEVPFDGLTANGGIEAGAVLDDGAAAAITARFIQYQTAGFGTGEGTVYGDTLTTGFADGDNIEEGAVVKAVVNGSEVDNSSLFTGAAANGTLAVPGTASTNDSVIVNYDAGTVAIPEDAKVSDATSGAVGFAQRVYGALTTGSARIVNYDSTGGVWTDNNSLQLEDVVFYDAQVAGQVFSVGDVIVGATSGESGRVLSIIDDGDSTGKLVLASKTGAFTLSEDIEVGGVKIAEVESTTDVLAAATLNIPFGIRTEQRATQGGIYDGSDSLNIVRSANALYSFLQDTFDELVQLDDQIPMSAQVLDQVYTLINGWKIPDLSMRFLEKGSILDAGGNNVFTNVQTVGTLADIGDHGFLYDSANPTPQPNIYISQGGTVLSQTWLEGQIDVLVKVKTNTDTTKVDSAVPQLGVLINSGTSEVFAREYLRTYDVFEFTNTTGGVVVAPLATADDLDNTTGTHEFTFTGGVGTPFTVGEEIIGGTSGAIGIVTSSDTGASGSVGYVLKTTTQFAGAETATGQVSGATAAVGAVSSSVAGYDSNIRIMTVDRSFTGGTTAGGPFVLGEQLSQAVSGATGFLMEDDGGTLYVQDSTGTFDGTNTLTGAVSGATNTPSSTTTSSVVPKDIEDGNGDQDYTAVISADITGAAPQLIADVYEWAKYVTRGESLLLQGGPGTAETGIEGRIYRRLVSTFAEVKASPYGTFAGGVFFGAQGVYVEKDTLDPADIQSIRLIDNSGATRIPPNLQALSVTSVVSGDRVSVFRTTGASSTIILTNEFDVGTVGSGNNQSADSTVLIGDGNGISPGTPRTVSPTPADVPSTGVLRILDPNDTGNFLRFPYTSVDRTTNIFSLPATVGSVTGAVDLTADDDVFVVFIEEQAAGTSVSNTIQYISDIPLLVRVRRKGILPFETPATFGSTGASVAAIRTADPIVNLP